MWIVGVWHLKDYVDDDGVPRIINDIGNLITVAVLGVFTFISGFFLKKYSVRSFSDALYFYKKRLIRLWWPFLVAASTMYIASFVGGSPWFENPMSFVMSLLGLSVFMLPLPSTFWYVSMLLLFYLLTPLMLFPKRRIWKYLLEIAIELAFIILWMNGITDFRYVLMYPMFVLGMAVNNSHIAVLKSNGWWVAGVSILLLVLSVIYPKNDLLIIVCWQVMVLPLLIIVSSFLSKIEMVAKAGTFIAYSSMNMYLFHRHVYLFLVLMLNIHSLSSIRDATMPLWFGWLIALPLIIVLSYFLQKAYDRFVTAKYGGKT